MSSTASKTWSVEVEIQQRDAADPKRKTRQFGAHLVGLMRADRLLDRNPDEDVRPALAVFAATELEGAAFEANLREGRPCVSLEGGFGRKRVDTRYEFPTSLGYAWRRQRTEEGVLITAYLPGFFAFDPGFIDEEGARFVAMPSQSWADAQRELMGAAEIEAAVEHCDRLGLLALWWNDAAFVADERPKLLRALRAMVPTAALAVAMLDRRVRAPIIADLRFQLQVFLAMHRATVGAVPLAFSPLTRFLCPQDVLEAAKRGFEQHGLSWHAGKWTEGEERARGLGYEPAVAVKARHEHVEQLLAAEVGRFREAVTAQEEADAARAERQRIQQRAARDVKRPFAKRKVA